MTDDTAAIDAIALSHGQARWVLWHLGMRVGDDDAKFDSWLKYVRRMGVPFWPDELGHGTGINVIYRYHHLMELAVALALRAQGILPRDLLGLLARYRELLRTCYRRAWIERESGIGAPIVVHIEGADEELHGMGTYLHLRLSYEAGGLLTYVDPQLTGPQEALQAALTKNVNHYPRPPLPLSDLAEDIVRLAGGAPEIRRGPA